MTAWFSDVLFDYQSAKDTFEGDVAGAGFEDWDGMHGDRYDTSIEFHNVGNDVRLSREAKKVIFDAGFVKIYLNHKDGWETHYFWDMEAEQFKESRAHYPHKQVQP